MVLNHVNSQLLEGYEYDFTTRMKVPSPDVDECGHDRMTEQLVGGDLVPIVEVDQVLQEARPG